MGGTLRSKINSIYLGLVILIAIVGTSSAFNLYRLTGSINGLMTDNYKSINATNHMMEAIERQDRAMLLYISSDRQKAFELFQENNIVFLNWHSIENSNITESGERELVSDILINYKEYSESFSILQEIRLSKGENEALEFYTTTITPQFSKIKDSLIQISQINENAMFFNKNNATENSKKATMVILVLTVFTTLFGFFLSKFITGRFLKPVYSLVDTMKKIKNGDLAAKAEIHSKDEIGLLATELNNLSYTLKQYKESTLGQLMNEKNKSIAIVKSINEPLIVLNNNFKILLINKASEEFFTIVEKNVIGKHFLEVIRNKELFDFISTKSEKSEKEKIICLNSCEAEYYFNVSVTEAISTDNVDSEMIVVLQNVTQLKQLDKMRTDFIATISHEFKTPLTSIIMGTEMLRDGTMGSISKDQEEVLTAIKEDGDRLSTLVNDLLQLTRIELGKSLYKFEACHIDGILDASIKQFINQAQIRDIDLILECEDDLPMVRADYEKIMWVINNLVSNALKYTNAGDEIIVSAEVLEDKMNITVKDTGAGIPEEFIDRIFDKFVQVKDGEVEGRGTGIGLSIVKDIIEAHGGHIECRSKIDSGSCFTFTLNLA